MTCVYIISNGQGQVKIGRSADPKKRLGQLQTASPHHLEMLWSHDYGSCFAAEAIETSLHRKAAGYAIRGEWFDDLVLEELAACLNFRAPPRLILEVGANGIYNSKLKCHVEDWQYVESRLEGYVNIREGENVDIEQCIDAFCRIDPLILTIKILKGDKDDSVYGRSPGSRHWKLIEAAA